MKLPWSKPQVSTYETADLDKQLRGEAGLTEIKGSEQLRKRVEFLDEGMVPILDVVYRQIEKLTDKQSDAPLTPEEIQLLLMLNRQFVMWTFYRQYKKASIPHQIPGGDKTLSKKASVVEQLFFRTLENESMYGPMLAALQYNTDIGFKEEWHVKPAPSVFIQTPVERVMPGFQGITATSSLRALPDKPGEGPRQDMKR